MTEATALGKKKKDRFLDRIRDLVPGSDRLELCLT